MEPQRDNNSYREQKPNSPNSSVSSSSNNSSSTNGGGAAAGGGGGGAPLSSPRPPLTPKSSPGPGPIPNNYPTTFIQADTQSFKQVVQMLTGSTETKPAPAAQNPHKNPIPPLSKPNKKPTFKLYERRNSMKNLKMISPLIPSPFIHSAPSNPSPGSREILSPSVLDFPKLALSPVTPLSPDPFNRSPEERAIAEKGFYLHPSPREAEPPKLLPLFPLTSPRMESASAGEIN